MGIRPTGFDTPLGGISWEFTNGEKECAYRIIKYLEDRRVIYNPQFLEVPDACISSIHAIREYLTREVQNNANNTKINDEIEKMRGYCRDFLNRFENEYLNFNFWSYTLSNHHTNNYGSSYGDKEQYIINRYPDKGYIDELQRQKTEIDFVYELAIFRKKMLDSIIYLSNQYHVKVSGELAEMINNKYY